MYGGLHNDKDVGILKSHLKRIYKSPKMCCIKPHKMKIINKQVSSAITLS